MKAYNARTSKRSAVGLPRLATTAATICLMLAAGCSAPTWTNWRLGAAASQPAAGSRAGDAALFAPLPTPEGFDPVKAAQGLEDIPGDPPAPAKAEAAVEDVPAAARRHLEEAQRLFEEQRYTETIAELEKAQRYSPNNPDAHRQMALACLLSGNEARARLAAERALAVRPNDLPSHFVTARFADKAGKPEEALRHYRLALKCDVGPGEQTYRVLTHYYLGVHLYDQGYYAAAARELQSFESGLTALGEDGIAENPALASVARVQRAAASIRAARANAFLGRYAAAAEAMKLATVQLPKDTELRSELIRMLVRAKRNSEAVEQASRLLADHPTNRQAVELLLAVHRYTGHPDRGLAAIRAILAEQPDNADLRLVYADALLSSGKRSDAAAALDEMVRQNPRALAARWKLVELYRAESRWNSWLAALAGVLATDPGEYVRAGRELQHVPAAEVRKLLDRGAGALETAAAASQPSDALASAEDYLLGRLSDNLDRLEDARRHFERAAQRTPEFLPAAIATAEMFVRRCRWTEAIAAVEAAQKSRAAPAHQLERLLGQAYDGLDDIEAAVEHYREAIKLNSADTRSMMLLGKLYDRTGQPARAQKEYKAAVVADPSDMLAREALIQSMLTRLGSIDQRDQLSRVLGELNEMQRRAPGDPASIRSAALLKFLTNRDREAYLRMMRQLVEAHPHDLHSREDLAKALFEFRRFEPLRHEISELLAHDSRSPLANELLASMQIRMLEFDEAGKQLERMLELYPNRETWLRQLIELGLIGRDHDAAIEVCRRLLATRSIKGKPERELPFRSKLMQCYHEAGRFEQARGIALDWLAAPKLETPVRQRYRAFVLAADAGAGADEQYIADCQSWLQADPAAAEVQRWLLLGLIQQDRKDEAVVRALSWLAAKPQEKSRFDSVLEIVDSAGRADAAIELVSNQVAAAAKPEEQRARLGLLASAYLRGKRYDAAIEALKQMILQLEKSEDDTYELQKMLARVYAQAERYDEALSTIAAMLAELSSDLQRLAGAQGPTVQARALAEIFANNRRADLFKLQALVHQRKGDIESAIAGLRQAYALTPQDVGLNNDFGYMLADAGQELDEARDMVRFALGEEPRQIAYMDSYGWVLYKLGDFEGALRWLERACQPSFTSVEEYLSRVLTNPADVSAGLDAVILDHLGDVQWRLDRREAAVASWKKSQEVYARQVAASEENADKRTMERVAEKLAAAAAGKEPELAAVGSRPAQ